MQESIAESLVTKIRARMETLRVGSPLDKAIDIGAIVAPVQLERIRKLVDQGVAEGATCNQPGTQLPVKLRPGWAGSVAGHSAGSAPVTVQLLAAPSLKSG